MSHLSYLLGGTPDKAPEPKECTEPTSPAPTPVIDTSKFKVFEVEQVKKLTLQEMRSELRVRGLNPAGGIVQLEERLTEAVTEQLKCMPKDSMPPPQTPDDIKAAGVVSEHCGVTYQPHMEGGADFFLDRPVQRHLAPPGGKSTVHLG